MYKRVLVIAAHSDDGEWGCGGTIAKLIKSGTDVQYLFFCYPMTEDNTPSPEKENIDALIYGLGLTRENIINDDIFDTRHLPDHRQKILDKLYKLRNRMDYDLVFCPSTFDTHQDHAVVSKETFRAFKGTNILGYELLWNTNQFHSPCYIELSQNDLSKKITALSLHQSQNFRPFMAESNDIAKALAVTRGIQCGVRYAESFEVQRWIIKNI